MKSPAILALAAALLVAPSGAFAEDRPAAKPPKQSLTNRVFNRVLHPFGGGEKTASAAGAKPVKAGKDAVVLKLDPQPLKLSEHNRLKVTLTLSNTTKKLMQLEFPTSQRIEVLLKTTAGKTVEQWSQDQAFANEPTIVTVNPGERAEYTVEVATRELVAGETYLVEGFLPSHETLRGQASFVPQK